MIRWKTSIYIENIFLLYFRLKASLQGNPLCIVLSETQMSIIIHNCWWYDVLKIIANKTSLKSGSFFFFLSQSADAPYLYVASYFVCLFVRFSIFCF